MTKAVGKSRKRKVVTNAMTRLELLTLLLSIQALLESGNEEKAKEIIAKVIAEAENDKQKLL